MSILLVRFREMDANREGALHYVNKPDSDVQTAWLFPTESRFKCVCAGPEKGGLRKGRRES